MTGRKSAALGVAFTLAVLVAGGCSGAGEAPKVAAVVQGTEIPTSETEALLHAYEESEAPAGAGEEHAHGEKSAARLVVLYQIKHVLLRQLAGELGVSAARRPEDGDVVGQLAQAVPAEGFRQAGFRPGDLTRSDEAGQLSKAMAEKLFPDVPVADEAVREEYERRTAAYQRSWRVAAQVAPFGTAEPARQVKARVAAGEPFEAVARGLGAADVGRVDISPISPLPPPVLDAIGKLGQGEVSEPLQVSSTGWASIFVERREELPELPLDDVRAEIVQFLAAQQRQSLFSDWFDKKLSTARIRVSGHFGRWEAERGIVG